MKMGRVDNASKRYAVIENISFIKLYRTEIISKKIQTLCQNQNKQNHTRAIRSYYS